MNILAIDFGTKHLGLAWAGSGVDVVLPYGRIAYTSWKKELSQLIVGERITKVVVGIPYTTEGEEALNTKRVREFVRELEECSKISIDTIDERFTTKEAQRMEGDATLDEKSAMLILTQYLKKK